MTTYINLAQTEFQIKFSIHQDIINIGKSKTQASQVGVDCNKLVG